MVVHRAAVAKQLKVSEKKKTTQVICSLVCLGLAGLHRGTARLLQKLFLLLKQGHCHQSLKLLSAR